MSDVELRRAIFRWFVDAGRAPTPDDVEAGPRDFARLAEQHAVVLDGRGEIVIANPFSGVETDFVVQADGRWWFANCAWDGLGILAALGADGRLRTRCSDCGHELELGVHEGAVAKSDAVAHFRVPAADWYEDLAYT